LRETERRRPGCPPPDGLKAHRLAPPAAGRDATRAGPRAPDWRRGRRNLQPRQQFHPAPLEVLQGGQAAANARDRRRQPRIARQTKEGSCRPAGRTAKGRPGRRNNFPEVHRFRVFRQQRPDPIGVAGRNANRAPTTTSKRLRQHRCPHCPATGRNHRPHPPLATTTPSRAKQGKASRTPCSPRSGPRGPGPGPAATTHHR